MQISGSVALVTGANRGLGLAFTRELVRRGAAKVYGAARDPGKVTEPGVQPVALDITDGDQMERAAEQCADVSLLVNNAGVLRYSTFTSAPDLDAARQEMETNYFGTLRMCRAFAPVLAAAGGGAPARSSTRSRPARSRCWPTSGPGTSRPSCPATTSSSTRPSRSSGTPRSAAPADPW